MYDFFRSNARATAIADGACFNCGKTGHFARDCSTARKYALFLYIMQHLLVICNPDIVNLFIYIFIKL